MHNLSYDFGDPFFETGELRVALRVWTLENVYGLDADKVRVHPTANGWLLEATGLMAAGGQLRAQARLEAEARWVGGELRLTARAEHGEKIKAIGALVQGLAPVQSVLEYPWTATQPEEVTRELPVVFPEGALLRYPQADLGPFPVFLWRGTDGAHSYALNMDEQVRPKRFAVYWNKRREQVVDLICAEAATRFRNEIEMPEWRIGRVQTMAEVYAPRLELMERVWGLRAWGERADVPDWMRGVSLVVTLHGEDWTGYAHNTYARMLERLRWIAGHIEGRRVLVFLPGWDGRYYYNYPLYRPSERLGGAAGFAGLVEGAHALGMHVAPMLGLNGINLRWAKELGLNDAVAHTAQGWEDIVNFVDWDADRSGEEQVHWANPGNPAYQDHLLARVSELVERFGVDSVFFDIVNWYANDPRWDYFEGTRALCERIKGRFPQLLLFGEGWYDALLPLIPLYHTQIFPAHVEAFTRYARQAYHLSLRAPGAGSTGVHEAGFGEYVPQAFSPILIPTLPIVDDTLPDHAEDALRIIGLAKEYAARVIT